MEAPFLKEGECWTTQYEANLFRLRDAKGMRYIAHLLRHPSEPFDAQDLLRTSGSSNRRAAPARTNVPARVASERARLAVTKRI